MKKMISAFCMAIMFLWIAPAFAVPALQLDIGGGYYNTGGNPLYDDETIIASGDIFTLYALMQTSRKTSLQDVYYISLAVYPGMQMTTSSPDYGSITFDGQTFNIAQDLVYGNPGLSPHGVFDTYYTLYPFQFQSADQVGVYDTQDNTGQFSLFTSGSGLYYAAFDVNTTSLSNDVSIHFDLFNDTTNAPFSHDAQSDPPSQVAEPGALVLLGLGMIGLAGIRKRFRR